MYSTLRDTFPVIGKEPFWAMFYAYAVEFDVIHRAMKNTVVLQEQVWKLAFKSGIGMHYRQR